MDGVWGRATVFDALHFYTAQGEKIYLPLGQTWVHVIPSGWVVPST